MTSPPLHFRPREFTCIDCGVTVHRVVVFAANDQDLCLECTWLRDIEDIDERRRLREFMRSRDP